MCIRDRFGTELRKRGVKSLKVVYSKEKALTPIDDMTISCRTPVSYTHLVLVCFKNCSQSQSWTQAILASVTPRQRASGSVTDGF